MKKKIVRDAILMFLVDGPASALEIKRHNAKIFCGFWGPSRLYTNLWGMVDEGILESHESEPVPERGGRPRTIYRLGSAFWE